jgi:type IV secretory pathway VirB10-like protein
MTSGFLLFCLAMIVYIMKWMIDNDRVQRIEDQKGLLRFIVPKQGFAEPEEAAVPAPAARRHPPLRAPAAKPPAKPRAGPARAAPAQQVGRRGPSPETPAEPSVEAEEEIIHPLWRGRPPKHKR